MPYIWPSIHKPFWIRNVIGSRFPMNPMNRIQSLNQHLYLHLNHHSTAFNLIHAFPFLDIPGADIPTGKDLSALDVDQWDWDYVDELLEEMEKNSFELLWWIFLLSHLPHYLSISIYSFSHLPCRLFSHRLWWASWSTLCEIRTMYCSNACYQVSWPPANKTGWMFWSENTTNYQEGFVSYLQCVGPSE